MRNPPLLRLLADDLTGALDTAAELAALCGPVPVRWNPTAVQGSAAFSSASREAPREAAIAAMLAFAPLLNGAEIAYRKLDSLLRGNVAAELAAFWSSGFWRHCVLAPAFPAQGRIARDGRVLARRADGVFAPITMPDWAAEGLMIKRGQADQPLPEGITWFDAETDEDLARIAALGRTANSPVLWAGSGGLARALAGAARVRSVADPHLSRWLHPIAQLDDAPLLFPTVERRCTSFSQWWTRTTRGLQQAEQLL